MTPSSLRRWSRHPISERDRQRAFALAAAVLAAAAAILTLTARSVDQSAPPETSTPPSAAPIAPAASAPAPAPTQTTPAPGREQVPQRVARLARRFLSGYLPYIYGRRREASVPGASRALRRRLAAANRPRVSPATRRRRPRIVAIDGTRVADRSHAWAVTARIADGSAAVYPIELLIEHRAGRLVVVQIGGE